MGQFRHGAFQFLFPRVPLGELLLVLLRRGVDLFFGGRRRGERGPDRFLRRLIALLQYCVGVVELVSFRIPGRLLIVPLLCHCPRRLFPLLRLL